MGSREHPMGNRDEGGAFRCSKTIPLFHSNCSSNLQQQWRFVSHCMFVFQLTNLLVCRVVVVVVERSALTALHLHSLPHSHKCDFDLAPNYRGSAMRSLADVDLELLLRCGSDDGWRRRWFDRTATGSHDLKGCRVEWNPSRNWGITRSYISLIKHYWTTKRRPSRFSVDMFDVF